MRRSFLPSPTSSSGSNDQTNLSSENLLGRRSLPGMLSEALCSRARRVSERRTKSQESVDEEVPFARRAREQGRTFRGGKVDDISVVVAVISPQEASVKQRAVRGRGAKTT